VNRSTARLAKLSGFLVFTHISSLPLRMQFVRSYLTHNSANLIWRIVSLNPSIYAVDVMNFKENYDDEKE